jgi:hypothetical protein
MSNKPNRKPLPSSRPSRVSQARRQGANERRVFWLIGIVTAVVVLAAAIAYIGTRNNTTEPQAGSSDGLTTATKLTATAQPILASVGAGSTTSKPVAVNGAPLTADGKPLVLYVGAEYCPFCAAQRWAMVLALSRFGSFDKIDATHSAADDVYPNTATFSFHGARYTSSVISFTGVETSDNTKKPLDQLAADQQNIFNTYNAPPYVSAQSAGAIPFIAFGGKYILSGAGFSPEVLQGKTPDEIAAALADANGEIAKGIIGTANVMTATICTLTNNQPANVCTDPSIQTLQGQLAPS